MTNDWSRAMEHLRTAPGVSRDDVDAIKEGVLRMARSSKCAHCGLDIEDRGDPSMDGNHEVRWVHVDWGGRYCFPQQGAASPRATPAAASGPGSSR